jgi:hypothetical protein
MSDFIKTGEVFDRDDDGFWLCESWLDEESGEVHTTRKQKPEFEGATDA